VKHDMIEDCAAPSGTVGAVVLRPITRDNYTIDASGRPYMQCECGRWTHHVSVRLTWLCKCGKEWRSTQAQNAGVHTPSGVR
jgi:hypothetical protein